ncbi:MAG TPA: tRNA (adenosine(37)-N6)-threonylcarbamoyltransferase complex ATPase subunit type 1 TsaE [Abditibacteriaceae bacterium]|jgi:tRNA threonylcarbamoyladenosine biosynthesis protein TsaE
MRTRESFLAKSADETRALGEQLGQILRAGDLVTLSGALGAGKTTFVQGVARALGLDSSVVSPTFVLIIEHDGPVPLLHLDAYRLESLCYDAIRDAGVMDLLEREDAVKIVEWPERIADWLPSPKAAVSFAPGAEENERRIEILTS